jgi:hypothetical protein
MGAELASPGQARFASAALGKRHEWRTLKALGRTGPYTQHTYSRGARAARLQRAVYRSSSQGVVRKRTRPGLTSIALSVRGAYPFRLTHPFRIMLFG